MPGRRWIAPRAGGLPAASCGSSQHPEAEEALADPVGNADKLGPAFEQVGKVVRAAYGADSARGEGGSCYAGELIRRLAQEAGDPDAAVLEWLDGRTPLGVHAPIEACGIFPLGAPGEASLASRSYYEHNVKHGWAHCNYQSFTQHAADAKAEVRRLVAQGFLEELGPDWQRVLARWPDAICTKLACLVKPATSTKPQKVRLIVDMRRSGAGSTRHANLVQMASGHRERTRCQSGPNSSRKPSATRRRTSAFASVACWVNDW